MVLREYIFKFVLFSFLAIAGLSFTVTTPGFAQSMLIEAPISSIVVTGNQRIESGTIKSYLLVTEGDPFSEEKIDASLKRLFATGLFADVRIGRDDTTLVVQVVENPIINRIVFEGNKFKDDDKLYEEVQMRPRIVYTRAKVSADAQRIIEIYRRAGRFSATVEPKVIQLPQNRVNLVFEISEGPKTKISKINFMGNSKFSNGDLRGVLATRESRWWRFFTSEDTYDPDRLAYDKQLLREFYRERGYADFRITSAVAELSPDKKHFFINFTVEEGELYKFGEINIESEIRDLDADELMEKVATKTGEKYNAKLIDNTVDKLTDEAGLKGYAFVDIRPRVRRDREARLVNLTYVINKAPRVYVERIDIQGNVRTLDEVIRREMRLVEGDAFNTAQVRRSRQRVKGLGFFKEAELEQVEGSTDDKTVLQVTVEEQSTGELSVGAGFSSNENFLFDFSIRERNFLGRGQDLRLGFRLSSERTEVDLGFSEPYFMGKPVVAGIDLYARQTEFEESGYEQDTYGFGLRAAFPVTEYVVMSLRYNLRQDKVKTAFQRTSPYLNNSEGRFTTSAVGYGLIYDTLDNRQRPSSGQRAVFNQDFAGLAGNVSYVRNSLNYDYYIPVFGNWVLNFNAQGGHLFGIGKDIRINDRFFLGGPRIRGFKQAGVGPKDRNTSLALADDPLESLGGNTYYKGGAELFLPLGSGAKELGLEVSTYLDVGALFTLDEPKSLPDDFNPAVTHVIQGDSASPRVSLGVGLSWSSPFGPFRLDFAKALKKQDSDETEFFQFNIGTRF